LGTALPPPRGLLWGQAPGAKAAFAFFYRKKKTRKEKKVKFHCLFSDLDLAKDLRWHLKNHTSSPIWKKVLAIAASFGKRLRVFLRFPVIVKSRIIWDLFFLSRWCRIGAGEGVAVLLICAHAEGHCLSGDWAWHSRRRRDGGRI
jgi:hypothetical protein